MGTYIVYIYVNTVCLRENAFSVRDVSDVNFTPGLQFASHDSSGITPIEVLKTGLMVNVRAECRIMRRGDRSCEEPKLTTILPLDWQ